MAEVDEIPVLVDWQNNRRIAVNPRNVAFVFATLEDKTTNIQAINGEKITVKGDFVSVPDALYPNPRPPK
jgi:hypothetical protein